MAQDAATQRGGSAARPRPHGGPEDRAGSMRAARSERGQSEAGRAWRCGGCRLGGDGAIWGLSRGKKQLWVNFVGTTDKDRRDDFRGIYGKIRPCLGDGLICRSLIRGNPERPGGGAPKHRSAEDLRAGPPLGARGRGQSRESRTPRHRHSSGTVIFHFCCSLAVLIVRLPPPKNTHTGSHTHTHTDTRTPTRHTHTLIP